MPESQAETTRLAEIRAIALDVDGVLTDGGFWWGADGEELKRFSFIDVMGLSLARRAGFKPGPVWTNPQRLFSVHWLHAP